MTEGNGFPSKPSLDPRSQEAMDSMAEFLDTVLNGQERGDYRMVGFAIMVFPWGEADSGPVNYISNAKRDEVIALMKQQVRFFEGGRDA